MDQEEEWTIRMGNERDQTWQSWGPPQNFQKRGGGIFQTVKVNHNTTEGKLGIMESAVERIKTFEGQSSCWMFVIYLYLSVLFYLLTC